MKREILFRGINFQKEWVYGDLFHSYANDDIAIAYYREGSKTPTFDAIFPESFGQYTGLTDKNGVKIFEGDIVRFSYITDGIKPIEIECLAKVVFEDGSFMIKCIKGHVHNSIQRALFAMDYFNIKVEVIGNVTDNPELMK